MGSIIIIILPLGILFSRYPGPYIWHGKLNRFLVLMLWLGSFATKDMFHTEVTVNVLALHIVCLHCCVCIVNQPLYNETSILRTPLGPQ